tara:strand:+ start:54 stop:980 length:927 start_codon:yes stop_codon:yes gene_type:complete
METIDYKCSFGIVKITIDGDKCTGSYQKNGEFNGSIDGNIVKATWNNEGQEGLIVLDLSDDKLAGKWKKGLDDGPMRGKWNGVIVNSNENNESDEESIDKIIRVCAEKINGSKSIALTKAFLTIYFNDEHTFAYGAATKFQGGGGWGEYHIIGHSEGPGSAWEFSIGNYKPIDNDLEQFENAGSQFKGFNGEEAEKYFKETGMDDLYDEFNFQLAWLDEDGDWNDVNFIPKEDHDFFEWEGEWGPSESGEYSESHLCKLNNIKGAEEDGSILWYSKNDCGEELLKQLEKENAIMKLSNMISGHSHFLR